MLDAIYIIGFGKARPDNDRPDAQTVEQLDIPGSSFDLAPNYQSGGSLYPQAFDVYSFGVLLVEIGRWEPNPVARRGRRRCKSSTEEYDRLLSRFWERR
jgi:hypothetical protein